MPIRKTERKEIRIDNFSELPFPFNKPEELWNRSKIVSFKNDSKNYRNNYTVGEIKFSVIDENGELEQAIRDYRFIGRGITVREINELNDKVDVFTGYVNGIEYDRAKGMLRLSARYYISKIKSSYFIFDYQNLKLEYAGRTYGTVVDVTEEGIIVNFPDVEAIRREYFRGRIRSPLRIYYDVPFVTYPVYSNIRSAHIAKFFPTPRDRGSRRRVLRLERNNEILEDFVSEQNYMKFTNPRYNYNPPGDFGLEEIPEYQVEGGTLISQVVPGFDYLAATFYGDDEFIRDVKGGYNVWVRKPLVYVGNPIDIFKSILTDSYTSMYYYSGTIPVDDNSFATASRHYNTFFAFYDVPDNNIGGPAQLLKSLSDEFMFDFHQSKSGKINITPIYPSIDKKIVATLYGTDVYDYREEIDVSDTFAEGVAEYKIITYTEATLSSKVKAVNRGINNYFGSTLVPKKYSFNTVWDDDIAKVLLTRRMYFGRRGIRRISFKYGTSMFGLANIDAGTYIRYIDGAFNTVLYVDSFHYDPVTEQFSFSCWDYNYSLGSANAMRFFGDGVTYPTTMSSTTTAGFTKLDESMTGSGAASFVLFASTVGSRTATINLNFDYDHTAVDGLLATTGHYFRLLFPIGATTWVARYTKIDGDIYGVDLITGQPTGHPPTGTYYCYGTITSDYKFYSQPINEKRDDFGNIFGGTAINLDSQYGTNTIWW